MAWKLTVAALLAAALAGAALAGGPRVQHTPADTAKAKGALLRRADFPAGWMTQPPSISGRPAPCKSFSPNESDLVETGAAVSPAFTAPDGFSQVYAVVAIFKTAAQAQADWSRVVRPAMFPCFVALVTKLAPAGSAVSVVSQGAVTVAKQAPRTAAYSLVVGVTPKGAQAAVKLYLDVVLLGRGRVEAAAIMVGVGQPYPGDFEATLVSVLAGRLA